MGGTDAFVRKYDSAGNVVWTYQFGTSGGDSVEAIAVDGQGNIFVGGSTNGTLPGQTLAGDYDAFIAKLRPPGLKR